MKPIILVVDDHKDILDFVSAFLSDKYTVMTAANGQAAMLVLEQEAVQLVVSDVMMPVMDGFKLCANIKSNFDYCHIPVILLTAKNTLQSRIEGLETGADAYIEKPFSPEHLQVQIANLLSNRNKIREYFASSPLVHIKTMAYSKADEQFLEKLNELVYQHIEDTSLSVDHLADLLNMSRASFYRKIKAISDLTPNELINVARLKRAAELLAENDYKIYEVAEMTGFGSQTHFGKNFTKQFGISPTEYAAMKRNERRKN